MQGPVRLPALKATFRVTVVHLLEFLAGPPWQTKMSNLKAARSVRLHYLDALFFLSVHIVIKTRAGVRYICRASFITEYRVFREAYVQVRVLRSKGGGGSELSPFPRLPHDTNIKNVNGHSSSSSTYTSYPMFLAFHISYET